MPPPISGISRLSDNRRDNLIQKTRGDVLNLLRLVVVNLQRRNSGQLRSHLNNLRSRLSGEHDSRDKPASRNNLMVMEEMIGHQRSRIIHASTLNHRIKHAEEVTTSENSLKTVNIEILVREREHPVRNVSTLDIECRCKSVHVNSGLELWSAEQNHLIGRSVSRHVRRVVLRGNELHSGTQRPELTKNKTRILSGRCVLRNVRNVHTIEPVLLLILVEQSRHEKKLIPIIRLKRSVKKLRNERTKTVSLQKCTLKNPFVNTNLIHVLTIEPMIIRLNLGKLTRKQHGLTVINLRFPTVSLQKSNLNFLHGVAVFKLSGLEFLQRIRPGLHLSNRRTNLIDKSLLKLIPQRAILAKLSENSFKSDLGRFVDSALVIRRCVIPNRVKNNFIGGVFQHLWHYVFSFHLPNKPAIPFGVSSSSSSFSLPFELSTGVCIILSNI